MTSRKPPQPERPPSLLQRYAAQTRRPLVSLAFAAPLLIVYEMGVVAFPEAARNGADVWMRGWLDALGLSGYFLLPALTVSLLLAWHHTTREPWRLSRGVLLGMTGESIALGGLLLMVAHLATGWLSPTAAMSESGLTIAAPTVEPMLARAVEYVGAGLYEEVLFRLLLLPVCLGMLATCVDNRRARTAVAILSTSLLFAAAHHVGVQGESFHIVVFLFRTAAGAFFATLFLQRGFGIAIGAHAAYDLIAGVGCH